MSYDRTVGRLHRPAGIHTGKPRNDSMLLTREVVMKSRYAPIAILGCLLALPGCDRNPADKATEATVSDSDGNTTTVTATGDSLTTKSRNGEFQSVTGTAVQVPDGFPKDVYLYTNATITSSMTMPQAQLLTQETTDPVDKVADAFQAGMPANGWKAQMSLNSGDSRMLTYTKDSSHVQVSIERDADNTKTTVSLMFTSGPG
jgi:hypothetical protein